MKRKRPIKINSDPESVSEARFAALNENMTEEQAHAQEARNMKQRDRDMGLRPARKRRDSKS